MQVDRTLPEETVTDLVAAAGVDAPVRTVTPADAGYLPVYRVTVGDDRELYLKTAPPGAPGDHGVGLEARVLAGLDRHGVAVPEVVGLVERREDLPTPALLMSALDGRVLPRSAVRDLSTDTLVAVARSLGRHLGGVHATGAVDAYGFLDVTGPRLDGRAPAGTFAGVTVSNPAGSWPAAFGRWADHAVGELRDSRFEGFADDVAGALDDSTVDDDVSPVLAHVDGAIENAVLRPDSPAVVGVLDWAFTVAATPAYDAVCVAHGLNGGPVAQLPGVPDRYDAVRDGLLAGYRDRAPERGARVTDRVRRYGDAYRLLALARGMAMCDDWFDGRGYGADAADRAAAGYRETVAALLAGEGNA